MYWIISGVFLVAMIAMAFLFVIFLRADRARMTPAEKYGWLRGAKPSKPWQGRNNSTVLCAGLVAFFAVLLFLSLTRLP